MKNLDGLKKHFIHKGEKMKKFIVIALMLISLTGCASLEVFDNKKEVGTLHGALTGAVIGGVVASPTAIGIPVGAFVGGVTGLVVGDVADKNDPRYYVDRTDETKKNVNIRFGGNLFTTLGLIFIVLKLLDVITWSWLWVLSPFWIPFVIGIILVILSIIFGKKLFT